MNLDQMKALLGMLHEHEVSEFQYKDEAISLRLRLGPPPAPVAMAAPAPIAAASHAPAAPLPVAVTAPSAAPTTAGTVVVESPMVGTLYIASAPGAEPFVAVGQRVEAGAPLCIIEAMKLMNVIEADVAGVLVERLVGDGQPVEYGQPIFRIRPD
jgi:acetyl-CoA carboxylase biotin carboxyl carrier protein